MSPERRAWNRTTVLSRQARPSRKRRAGPTRAFPDHPHHAGRRPNHRGHLYTTVLYVGGEEDARKVILPAKQRGQEGEALESLVYPARITFDGAAKELPGPKPPQSETARRWPRRQNGSARSRSLVSIGSQISRSRRVFLSLRPWAKQLFLAVEAGRRIYVGWPRQSDEKAGHAHPQRHAQFRGLL